MTTIGDTAAFAIEFDVIDGTDGHFRYWCGGRAVGNYDLVASLPLVLDDLMRFSTYEHRRESSAFMALTPDAAVARLEAGLTAIPRSVEPAVAEEWARHVITYHMDHGYRRDLYKLWSVYVFETGTQARVITRDPDSKLFSVDLAAGAVDNVLGETRHLLAKAIAVRN